MLEIQVPIIIRNLSLEGEQRTIDIGSALEALQTCDYLTGIFFYGDLRSKRTFSLNNNINQRIIHLFFFLKLETLFKICSGYGTLPYVKYKTLKVISTEHQVK
jgi:hypothetical protein